MHVPQMLTPVILAREPSLAHPFAETPFAGVRAVELAVRVGEMHLHVAVEVVGAGELAGAARVDADALDGFGGAR